MRRLVFIVGALAAISQASWGASVCANGTLASYAALGSGGCMIGNDLFSGFASLPATAGATAIPFSAINVTPSGGTTNPALMFSTTVSSLARQVRESIFSYTITGTGISASAITLAGATVTGDGNVTDAQNLCEGGTFGADHVSGCTGHADGFLTIAGVSATDGGPFASKSFVNVTDDFVVDGGLAGTASGGSFTDRFTAQAQGPAVPEPASTTLLFLGAGAITFLKHRSKAAKSQKFRGNL